MKLTKVQITNFRSIWDSTEFEIDDVTCLVGKNESGKTALLQALYKLNPINQGDRDFDARMDYPRQSFAQYRRRVEREGREHDEVVKATYLLEESDIKAVQMEFGMNCFTVEHPLLTLSKNYANQIYVHDLDLNEDAIYKHLITTANLPVEENRSLLQAENVHIASALLGEMDVDSATDELLEMISRISAEGFSLHIYDAVLEERVPRFLYFDEYYQMRGQDNLAALHQRIQNDKLVNSDYPLLGLIELAGLELEDLLEPDHTQTLTAEISAAESELSAMILPYWSQNSHLRMKFDIRVGLPNDPEGMRDGMNIWGLVVNERNMIELPIGSRSRGFVWFFSFLAWYANLRSNRDNLILLLDEPGLSLHAKAQEDLLRYIEKELKPHHQVIYTTHSPFMVDPQKLRRARLVQDMGMDRRPGGQAKKLGTEVIPEVHAATHDTLFPLQSALGYEIYQNLFIGPNCLVVEGVSDLMYIEVISNLLEENNRVGLSTDWTITPVGGVTNVPTFVALLGAQGRLNLALLIDNHKRDEQRIENLYKEKLLAKNKIVTYASFVPPREADVEDMFEPKFYLKLVNGVYGTQIMESDLQSGSLILRRIETHLENNPLPNNAKFNHYRPALYLSLHIDSLKGELSSAVLDRWECAFKTVNCLL